MSSSSQEIDLSLYTLQTYIEKELGDKKQINDREISLFIQKQKDWIGSVTRIHITDAKGQVNSLIMILVVRLPIMQTIVFKKEAQQKNTDQLFVLKLIRDPNGQGWVNLFGTTLQSA